MMPLFINPFYLSALVALSIPIIIHLLRSKKFELRQLGTIRFLIQAEKETASRRKLKNLLLLFCRLLIVALTVFIFARPFSDRGDNVEVMIFIDSSGSMAGQTASIMRFELALNKAREILGNLHESSRVRLFLFSDDVVEIDSLDEAGISPGGFLKYDKVFEFAATSFNQSDLLGKEMYLISDMQKESLPEKPLKLFPVDINVHLINLGHALDQNFAVTGVRNFSKFAGNTGGVEVNFKSSGAVKEDLNLTFELSIEGQESQTASSMASSGKVRFKWQPSKHGKYKGKVRLLEEDSFPLDNQRDFIFNIRKPDNILIINGVATQSRLKAPGYFIQKVLETSEAEGLHSGFSVETSLRVENLEKFSVVTLCDVKELLLSEIKELKEFIARGGGLLYFIGGNTNKEAFNSLETEGLFPGRLKVHRPAIPAAFDQWDKENSVFAVFENADSSGLKRLLFKSTYEMEPGKDAKVICKLGNDVPAIVEQNTGKSKIIVVTNPCDRTWSDWPTEKAFVPFIRSLLSSFHIDSRDPLSHPETELSITSSRKVGIHTSPLAVVVPSRRESVSGSVNEEVFRKSLGLGAESSDQKITEVGTREKEIWLILLIVVLCLLPVENLLADRSAV